MMCELRSTHLEEGDSVLSGDGLAPLLADHPLVLHVALVPQDHLLDVLVGVLLHCIGAQRLLLGLIYTYPTTALLRKPFERYNL